MEATTGAARDSVKPPEHIVMFGSSDVSSTAVCVTARATAHRGTPRRSAGARGASVGLRLSVRISSAHVVRVLRVGHQTVQCRLSFTV